MLHVIKLSYKSRTACLVKLLQHADSATWRKVGQGCLQCSGNFSKVKHYYTNLTFITVRCWTRRHSCWWYAVPYRAKALKVQNTAQILTVNTLICCGSHFVMPEGSLNFPFLQKCQFINCTVWISVPVVHWSKKKCQGLLNCETPHLEFFLLLSAVHFQLFTDFCLLYSLNL